MRIIRYIFKKNLMNKFREKFKSHNFEPKNVPFIPS